MSLNKNYQVIPLNFKINRFSLEDNENNNFNNNDDYA